MAHCLLAFPGAVLNEAYRTELPPYLSEGALFRGGRMLVSERPGLGVLPDPGRMTQVAEYTEARPASLYQGESYRRTDGSHLYL